MTTKTSKPNAKVTTKDLDGIERLNLDNVLCLTADMLNSKISKEEKQEIIKMCGHKKTVSFLVDQYYQSQKYRLESQNKIRSLLQGYDEAEIDHPEFIKKQLTNALIQESLNKKNIDIITKEVPICKWMRSICGIGPIFSAYLYSVFDITMATNPSEFLSYAGLNDNKNPWLGKEEAAKIVKETLKWRDEKIGEIEEQLKNICGDKFTKFKSQIKKLFKTTDEVYIHDILRLCNEIGISDTGELEKLYEEQDFVFLEWCSLQAHSDYVGDMVINKIAIRTNRKPKNVKKGTMNIKAKENKKKYPNVLYLQSYLAKPPYNKDLKRQCYLIGDAFMKNWKKPNSLYGHVYMERKIKETNDNEDGKYKETAKQILESKNWNNDNVTRKCLMAGKLSAAHINMRAKRYATKLFISHVHEAMYYEYYRDTPPEPYVIEYMGHHDYIPPETDYHDYLD